MAVAEFEGDRIRDLRQYWNEVELLDGPGLPPDRLGGWSRQVPALPQGGVELGRGHRQAGEQEQ